MPFPNLKDKVAVVTGANAGLGFQIAKTLYELGAHVVVAGRSESRIAAAIAKIQEGSKGADVGTLEAGKLDLATLAAVREFSDGIKDRHSRLDLLINNAGVMVPPAGKTTDGFELQFGINFVGHFALTGHLFSLLESTEGARVVTMSSIAHRGAAIDFENFCLERPYSQWREYGQSKVADLILAMELHRRLEAKGSQLASLGAHPGVSMTELTRHLGKAPPGIAFMSVEQGAQSALVAALSVNAKSGQYWGPSGPEERSGDPAIATVDAAAEDKALNERLWAWAEQATGTSFPT
ncbi:MAG: SDR family NAD(P)-dependent oxidoreductase [Nannocystaceae bacterium]|nr:SDR family NAD(P)-dependent oxidoreductase [Nannocystaceae bacterium]